MHNFECLLIFLLSKLIKSSSEIILKKKKIIFRDKYELNNLEI